MLTGDPQPAKRRLRGIAQATQVGRVDLRVAVELAEVGVDERRVQERREPPGDIDVEPLSRRVEDVEVVLEPNLVGRDTTGIEDRGGDAAALLLRAEALRLPGTA